jgi:hypothetical protein
VDSRSRNVFVLALVAVLAFAGAAVFVLGGGGTPGGSQTPAGTTPVVGVVVAVESGGLDDVRGFTLRATDDGRLIDFGLTALENGVEFPPGHLAEHQLTGTAIRVWYRPGDDPPLAIRLEDAP